MHITDGVKSMFVEAATVLDIAIFDVITISITNHSQLHLLL